MNGARSYDDITELFFVKLPTNFVIYLPRGSYQYKLIRVVFSRCVEGNKCIRRLTISDSTTRVSSASTTVVFIFLDSLASFYGLQSRMCVTRVARPAFMCNVKLESRGDINHMKRSAASKLLL